MTRLVLTSYVYNDILDADEGELRNIEVEDFVVRNLESFNISLAELSSSACPKLMTVTTEFKYNDTPSKKPLSRIPSIRELVCMRLFHTVSVEFPWSRVTSDAKMIKFQRLNDISLR